MKKILFTGDWKHLEIERLYAIVTRTHRVGRLFCLPTRDDPTIFFDVIGVDGVKCAGIYTVPEKPEHESTARIITAPGAMLVFVKSAQDALDFLRSGPCKTPEEHVAKLLDLHRAHVLPSGDLDRVAYRAAVNKYLYGEGVFAGSPEHQAIADAIEVEGAWAKAKCASRAKPVYLN